jgi:hypothetical protein
MRPGEIRFQRKGVAVADFGFSKPALLLEGVTEVVMRFSEIRLERKGEGRPRVGSLFFNST